MEQDRKNGSKRAKEEAEECKGPTSHGSQETEYRIIMKIDMYVYKTYTWESKNKVVSSQMP